MINPLSNRRNGADDHLPPHDPPAEQGVLGCILLSPESCITEYRTRFGAKTNVFYDLRHQSIIKAILDMDDDFEAVDMITLQQRLKNSGLLEDVGGLAYLTSLPDTVPSAANLSYYLDIVGEKYDLRRLVQTCTEIVGRVYKHQGDHKSLMDAVAYDLRKVFDPKTVHSLPPVVDAAAFVDSQIALPDELVKGLLHKGLKFSLGGGSKTCKSWVLLDLAISVANGSEWLGIKTNPAKVLFVNLEIPTAFFRKRMAKVCVEKEITLKPNCFDVWNLRGYNASFDDLLPKIISAAREMGYGLIIIDPIYKIYGGLKENAAEDMSQLMGRLEGVSHETGAAIGFAAHFSKGNQAQKDALDRISGSGVFARDPDTCMTMTALKQESSFAFAADGLRNFAPFKPFAIEWKYPLMRRNDDLDPGELKQAGGRPKTYNETKIADLLTPKPLSTSEWQKLSASELGTSKASFFRALEDLKFTQTVAKTVSDGKWFLQEIDRSHNSDDHPF